MVSYFFFNFNLFSTHFFLYFSGNKSITLYDIRAELNSRYKDLRISFASANPEELFDMLTKETPETFYIGKLVTASVVGKYFLVINKGCKDIILFN